MKFRGLGLAVAGAALGLLLACSPAERNSLSIVSGSENKSLEPLLERFERQERVDLRLSYLGSVDIMLELEKAEFAYDAVWPANSLWVSLGDRERRVKLPEVDHDLSRGVRGAPRESRDSWASWARPCACATCWAPSGNASSAS